jgi:hypothetical protein
MSAGEKTYWRDHKHEVDAGQIRSLTQSGAEEKATLAKVRTEYEKIYHTWTGGMTYPRGRTHRPPARSRSWSTLKPSFPTGLPAARSRTTVECGTGPLEAAFAVLRNETRRPGTGRGQGNKPGADAVSALTGRA